MHLYLIERLGEVLRGENSAVVVAADDAIMAREVAAKGSADEGCQPWLDHRRSTVAWIGTYDPRQTAPRVILVDAWEE